MFLQTAVFIAALTAYVGMVSGSPALITQDEFNKAVTGARTESPYPKPTAEQYKNIIARAGPAGKITTRLELAMFLANVLWESDGLRAKQEYNPGPYPYPQLDRPGKTYQGRGYMQLTWSYNYKDASMALYKDDRLLANPEKVATDDAVAWDTAFWFWSTRVHGQPGVAAGQFGATIKAINGGWECGTAPKSDNGKKRFQLYKNIFKTFKLSGNPDEHGCYN